MSDATEQTTKESVMESKDLTSEQYREYDFQGRVYRIDSPVSLFVGTTTHRVVDVSGVVHCVPSPGISGCVLRWQPKSASSPVQF